MSRLDEFANLVEESIGRQMVLFSPEQIRWLVNRCRKLEQVAEAATARLEVWTRETYLALQEALAQLDERSEPRELDE